MVAFYYLFIATAWCISLLPSKLLYVFSDLLYLITYYIFGYRKKVVINNLQNAFPEKSANEIKCTAKKFYKNFCDIIVETIMTLTIPEKELRARVRYINSETLDELHHQYKNVIAVQGHYCNWEWTVMMGPELKEQPAVQVNAQAEATANPNRHAVKHYAIYQPLSNKFFDQLIYRLRAKFGTELIHVNSTYKTMLKNKGKPGFYQLGADQTPPKDSEYWTSFLNQDTPVFLGIEKIAKAMDIPVVFINTQRIKRGYYEVEFIKLFENPKETSQYEITEKHVRTLEKIIRAEPANWLWSHRRWKHSR
ncbi:MAG: lysophospholipid acyltransferase family protein [Deltaproteobacteria bacterium]|nr:lysophospholipid acyltransferase family protein [Deltaproteobacteria bacterium]